MAGAAEDIVRRWLAALRAGSPGAEHCHPEIEIRNWEMAPVPGPYHGHQGLQQWWSDVQSHDVVADLQLFELREIRPVDDDRVLTVQRASGRGRSTGLGFAQEWGSVITVRDGKVASAIGYPSTAEARAAAGLGPDRPANVPRRP